MLEILLDAIPCSIWIIGLDGQFKFVNNHLAVSLNKSKKGIVEKTVFDIYGQELGREYWGNYELVKKLGRGNLFKGYFNDIFLKCYISPMKNSSNEIIGFLGILDEVTEEKKYEEEIINQKNLLATLIDTIPDSIFYKDLEGTYLNCNKAFARDFYDATKDNVVGKVDSDLTINLDIINNIKKTDKLVINTKEKEIVKLKIEKNNKVNYMECIKTPILDNNGKVNGIVGIARNITSKVLSEKELKRKSFTDKLTGVYNRTYFDEKINQLNKEKYLPLSLIMGDVDGLKVINDTVGHLKGDELLIEVADVLKQVCDNDNIIVRWGGDEFIILLPNTNHKKVNKICEKIKDECKIQPYSYVPLSISLGYATKNDMNTNIDDILKKAEEMAYKDKLTKLGENKENILYDLTNSLKEKSLETYKHTSRMEYFVKPMAQRLKLTKKDTKKLELLATFHDIGKISIPDEILSKPGRLSDKEMDIMRSHSDNGYRISRAIPEISDIAKEVLFHHERWDGKGYPLGLSDESIPYLARIISVIDSYEAMTSTRSYKTKMSHKEACEELKYCSASQFDPAVVDAFLAEFEYLEI